MSHLNDRKYKLVNNIASRRKLFNLSQAELGELVGCSRNTISNIECGVFEPTAYTAGLICSALQCSFEDIFFLVEL